ncbi:MAG: hypothetical protein ACU0E9_12240 [Limimaricola soesokkakensis]|uniref:Uncharacterized protein n=1 Tax=Limimaricola soesokkakensis TaxID=1343159 RepID=A0A1X6ZL56_9RHOB|nr:hypothetical protein [Limimaricola soesokkakensis]PSK84979.1 hypothetical protein CLV79_108147 [Limimaricola soesokkakensis]SLN54017.1 hypothetical protein LOS8367_02528 [Limimaricola soesokkakensis]
MRNWAIAFFALAFLSGLVCLGSNTPADLSVARTLMVLFGVLAAYAATAHRLQARLRERPGRGGPLGT